MSVVRACYLTSNLPGCEHHKYFALVCSDWMCDIKAVCEEKTNPPLEHDIHSHV